MYKYLCIYLHNKQRNKKDRFSLAWIPELCLTVLHCLKGSTVKEQQEMLRLTLQGSNGPHYSCEKARPRGADQKTARLLSVRWVEQKHMTITQLQTTAAHPQHYWTLNKVSLLNVTISLPVPCMATHAWAGQLTVLSIQLSWGQASSHRGSAHKQSTNSTVRCRLAEKSPTVNVEWKHSLTPTALGLSVLFCIIRTETWCMWSSVAWTTFAKMCQVYGGRAAKCVPAISHSLRELYLTHLTYKRK